MNIHRIEQGLVLLNNRTRRQGNEHIDTGASSVRTEDPKRDLSRIYIERNGLLQFPPDERLLLFHVFRRIFSRQERDPRRLVWNYDHHFRSLESNLIQNLSNGRSGGCQSCALRELKSPLTVNMSPP